MCGMPYAVRRISATYRPPPVARPAKSAGAPAADATVGTAATAAVAAARHDATIMAVDRRNPVLPWRPVRSRLKRRSVPFMRLPSVRMAADPADGVGRGPGGAAQLLADLEPAHPAATPATRRVTTRHHSDQVIVAHRFSIASWRQPVRQEVPGGLDGHPVGQRPRCWNQRSQRGPAYSP